MTCRIFLDVPGSTPEQRERGICAALEVFALAGISPEAACQGDALRAAWNAAGCQAGGISDNVLEACTAFNLARLAAIEACDSGTDLRLEDCRFEILPATLH